jgi:hypothetical protein
MPRLDALLEPELIQLPNLIHLSLQASGVSGTIPKEVVSQMTVLKRLLLGANHDSTGTIPLQIAKMTSMEQFIFGAGTNDQSNGARDGPDWVR